ncbi:iron-containing alcohol dehydrogenase [Endozoicomonas acroporae]|uniref:iron-containing alcohol dehydrogenase n=1 Tax=Endozoicomonas acroporae TaxID=1701104 RepID=UPI003D798AB7
MDQLCFSGGVAVHIYDQEPSATDYQYGDLGVLLGKAIRRSSLFQQLSVFDAVETIRATVIGAGSHATDISGSTINFSRDVFPIKNVPALRLSLKDEALPGAELAKTIREKLSWFDLETGAQHVALALKGHRNPDFQYVQELADIIIQGMDVMIKLPQPLIVIVEEGFGKVLGQSIEAKLKRTLEDKKDVICINTTAGTASEMTRFCIITNEQTHIKAVWVMFMPWRTSWEVAMACPTEYAMPFCFPML